MSDQRDKKLQKKNIVNEMLKVSKGRLKRLGHQYKIMEGTRLTYIEEMKVQLAKQKRQLNNLRRDKKLVTFGKLTSNTSKHNKQYLARLKELIQQKDEYEQMITVEKIKLDDIKKHMFSDDDTTMTRKFVEEDDAIKPTSNIVLKLDTKLAIALRNMNDVMCNNQKLRHIIENLLTDRRLFKRQLEHLLRTIYNGKKLIVALIENSLIAYEHRDEYMKKLRLLREENQTLRALISQDTQDYAKKVSQSVLCCEFLTIKGQRRLMKELEQKLQDKFLYELLATSISIRDYLMILRTLYSLFGQHNVDSLCAYYKKQEGENYALFNYVSEVNSETEILREQIEVMVEKSMTNGMRINDLLEHEFVSLGDLKIQYVATSWRTNMMQKKQEFMSMFLSNCLKALTVMFSFSFNTSPFYSLLGEREVNVQNVDMFLKIFEKRIMFLTQSVMYLEIKNPRIDLPYKKRYLLNREERLIEIDEKITRPPLLCPFCVLFEATRRNEDILFKWRRGVFEEEENLRHHVQQLMVISTPVQPFLHSVKQCRRN